MAIKSESKAWKEIYDHSKVIVESTRLPLAIRHLAEDMMGIAVEMQRQLKRGAHANPGLVMFNGRHGKAKQSRGDVLMSRHVQAILYIHEEDGKRYCHGFADAPIELKTRGDTVTIKGLDDETNVCMMAHDDGTVTIYHEDGYTPLHADF